jgi:hypothetical protein
MRTTAVTRGLSIVLLCAMTAALPACRTADTSQRQKTFDSARGAVLELTDAVKKGDVASLNAIFGPDAQALVDSSDPVTARRNQQVFNVAVAERWRLEHETPDRATLVIGLEEWPFPIPLVKEGGGWRFDTGAGKEEILARRIGRNELSVIRVCQTYVAAQRLYAKYGHDGKPKGLYARAFTSDGARQNGLYWPARHGDRRSPLGDLFAGASVEAEKRAGREPQPFHGYYFRILTAQGAAASGGQADYLANGELSRGFALVAWPAFYDVSGVMTFVVNHDGVVSEKDVGPDTAAQAKAMTLYNPDSSWTAVR